MALPVLPPGAGLGLQRRQHVLQPTEPVSIGIVPARVEDERARHQLRPCQAALAAVDRAAVLGQAPSGIEGLSENLRLVPGEDGLEPQLRGHRVDRRRAFHQHPRGQRIGAEADAVACGLGPVMAGAMAAGGFRVGLDDDARAGIFFLRQHQHFAERPVRGTAKPDRGIALRLVDDQHVTRRRRGQRGIDGGVFGQVVVAHPGDGIAGAVEQGGVVQRMGGQQVFEIRGLAAVEPRAAPVYGQPKRRLTGATGMERAQERILDPDHMRACGFGSLLAARRIGAVAPDQNVVTRPRLAESQVKAGQVQNAPDPPVGQEPAGDIERPPGLCGTGGRILGVARHAGLIRPGC